MNEKDKTDVYTQRRLRLQSQGQKGLLIGLLVLGGLVAGMFIWGNSLSVSSSSDPVVNANVPGPESGSGQDLYNQFCFGCHGASGDGNLAADIPALNQNGEAWSKTRAELEAHILDGGETMPELKGLVSPVDASMLINYIQLWWTPEQLETFNTNNN